MHYRAGVSFQIFLGGAKPNEEMGWVANEVSLFSWGVWGGAVSPPSLRKFLEYERSSEHFKAPVNLIF